MTNTSLSDIILDASMVSMFAEKKLLIVNDSVCFKDKDKIDGVEELEQYFTNYNHNNYIIFTLNSDKVDSRKKLYKQISQVGEVITVKKVDHDYLYNYVNSLLKENNYQMTSNTISYFINKVGSDLNNIKNELDKLFIYKIDDKSISKEDVDSLVVTNMEDEIFALSDAVINGDIAKSLEVYNEFINKNYEQVQMIAIIANQIRFLYQVKKLYEQGKYRDDIAKILEVHPYRVKLAIEKCYKYETRDLVKYLDKLACIDRDIKLGKLDKAIGLELFLINKNA